MGRYNTCSNENIAGLGTLTYPVTTSSEEAQRFFDLGLRLIYAFNHWEPSNLSVEECGCLVGFIKVLKVFRPGRIAISHCELEMPGHGFSKLYELKLKLLP